MNLIQYSLLAALVALAPACAPGSSGETDAGGETDSESGESEGDSEGEGLCEEPDEALRASFVVDHGDWPLDYDSEGIGGAPSTLAVAAASCTVDQRVDDDPFVRLELVCSAGDVLDMPIAITIEPPLGQAVPVQPGAAVTFDYKWNGDGHHVSEASLFALHDQGAALLVAGVDGDGLWAPEGTFAPLQLEREDGVCAPTCLDGGDDPACQDTEERLAIAVTHDEGAAIDVLDGHEDILDAGAVSYHVSVPVARDYICLNCGASYEVLILGQ